MDKSQNLDDFTKSLEGKTPREINRKIRDSIPKNMLLMSKIIPEIKERNEILKKDFPPVNNLIIRLKQFFEELNKEKVIKIEVGLFDSQIKEAQKEGDERASGIESFLKVKQQELEYKDAFNELNDFYHGAYCFVTKKSLKKIAEALAKKKLDKEGDVVQELNKYKEGKYKELFEVLKPQIKNSLSHKTAYIDRKEPLINYEDRNKPNLKLSLKELSEICDKLFFLQLALDILSWEFFMDFYEDIANKLKIVDEFIKKYDINIKWSGSDKNTFNLYNLGDSLEKNKGKW